VETDCHFCGAHYTFTVDEIEEDFAKRTQDVADEETGE
jgi:hypothetical protein